MNALKHMEFIFGGVMVIACLYAALPERAASPQATQAGASSSAPMPVVVVKAKRMTALEKRRSLEPDTAGS
ncbi:MAG TPA: hypothetical protein VFS02_04360 [Telluria sp.]|nr:hypothetical protein [Telluria sp.]